MSRIVVLVLLSGAFTWAATLAERIDKILNQPAARRAFWGIKVVDLGSGRTLYQRNADRPFVPASNTKLFSTALALVRLGPDHRYLTRLATDSPPDPTGRIAGDVVLVGGGDPNFSSRVLPYQKRTEFLGIPLDPLEELAAQVAALGVRQIDGDIVGDDTLYVWQRYADGWTLEDTANGDGPPVTALVVNDNIITLRIGPGEKAGDPALVKLEPWTSYYTIDNRIRTAAKPAHPVRIHREPGDTTLRLWGEIALTDSGRSEVLAIDDPALFAAQALRDALVRHSVTVLGRAVSRHAMPYEFEDLEKADPVEKSYALVLASRSSMALIEDLRLINKISQNLHAELALREVARRRRGVGSFEASLAELKAFLGEIGITKEEFFLRDGSGLSRQNLVTPAAIMTLLTYMWNSRYRERWLDTLPVAGFDGTLAGRFISAPAADQLRAKTGTLTHVSALSGYLPAAGGRQLAFAILVNNYIADSGSIRKVIDQICVAALVEL